MNNHDSYSKLLKNTSLTSMIVSILLICIKLIAWVMTNSISVLATLIDSCSDFFTSLINFIAINISLIPADNNHNFGHHKAQSISSLLQSIFILSSSIFLLFISINRIKNPINIEQSFIGINIIFISILMPLLLTIYQKYTINKTKSVAIEAEKLNYTNDILLNISVIISLYLNNIGFNKTDGILSLIISILTLYNAIKILKKSFDVLMDTSISNNDIKIINNIIMNTNGIQNYHDLLTRFDGKTYFAQFHIEIDKNISFLESHEITKNVIFNVKSQFKKPIEVIVHTDPV